MRTRARRAGVGIVVLSVSALAACTAGDTGSEGSSAPSSAPATSASPSQAALQGFANIQHVIVIVQENRSFDHYFGTFPGADGLPMAQGRFTSCVPDPVSGLCAPPYHDNGLMDYGGPHERVRIRGGRQRRKDGRLHPIDGATLASRARPIEHRHCARTTTVRWANRTSWGITTRARSPTTGHGASTYLLQDRLFAPTDSWTLPAHLFLVSAWSASCSDPSRPMSCRSDLSLWPQVTQQRQGATRPFYAWTDITYLLHIAGVSWGYYSPARRRAHTSARKRARRMSVQNPLPWFTTVRRNHQLGNIGTHDDFLDSRKTGRCPRCRGSSPATGRSVSTRDRKAPLTVGQAYVTKMVDAVMRIPLLGDIGHLPHVGRLGRLLRSCGTAARRCERLRPPRPRHRDLAVGPRRSSSTTRPCPSTPTSSSSRICSSTDGVWIPGPTAVPTPGRPFVRTSGSSGTSARNSTSLRSRCPRCRCLCIRLRGLRPFPGERWQG